jgi:redox-sensing transcriptional repressor
MIDALSQGTLQRLPQYLIMLKAEGNDGHATVTADDISGVVRVSPSQIRHDLTACGMNRAPGEQYDVAELTGLIEHALGYDDISNAVIVGAGQLGRALLSYQNYSDYGVDVIAAFDADESLVGREIAGRPVLSVKRMSSLCRRMKVHIGIITVPAPHAQEACDRLLEGGIQAIWNFAPVHLKVPDNVIVKNEIIAVSLGELSRQLQEKRKNS